MFDAYVRILVDDLARIQPSHLQSGADDPPLDASGPDGGTPLGGYTEWVADAPRTLSMGWDWSFDLGSRQLTALWHTLRTNIMVVDAAGGDLGRERTQSCIADLMNSVHWEAATAEAVGLPGPASH